MWEHAVRIARRNFVMCRESSELIVPIVEEHIAVDQECTDGLLSRRRESLVDLIHGAGGQDNHLLSDATGSRLDGCGSLRGLAGFVRKPINFACGTSSRNIPSRFATSVLMKLITPVALPPGRFMLVTKPTFIGSLPFENTIGIIAVAALAAIAELAVPVA